MGMDQYLLIPFLGGWTSIYQLFWGSLGTRVLTHPQMFVIVSSSLVAVQLISDSWDSWDPGIPTWGTKSFPPKKGSVSGDSTLYRWFFHDKATKKKHLGDFDGFWGYHHFRKPPYIIIYIKIHYILISHIHYISLYIILYHYISFPMDPNTVS